MKEFYAYLRVSTKKQERGWSLQEQRSAIEAYAKRNNLVITEWFIETVTAAKRGRPVFSRMMRQLRKCGIAGINVHKIDRGSRNGHDWADIGDLVDEGIEVHFAHETLDLKTRGGRLAADIQAAVSADYIRNLKQEIRKGQLGSLKQGLYPWEAPAGYRDMGKAQVKEIDELQGPLVKQMFELYATGNYSFHTLKAEMDRRGLRNRRGNCFVLDGLTRILNNPFYIGIVYIRKTNETFQGVHRPLITKELFDRVQIVLRGNRRAGAAWKHDLKFRRLIHCQTCGRTLIGEKQKNKYVYYRCHLPDCGVVCVNEATIDERFSAIFSLFGFDEVELGDLRDMVAKLSSENASDKARRKTALQLAIGKCDERLSALTDALLDGVVDKETYEAKKLVLLTDRRQAKDEIENVHLAPSKSDLITEYLELCCTAYTQYKFGNLDEIRDVVLRTTSNLSGQSNYPVIALKSPFQEMLNIKQSASSAEHQDDGRTRAEKVLKLFVQSAEEEISKIANDNAPRSSSRTSLKSPKSTSLHH